MKYQDIINNIAYCGLVCPLDSCFKNCTGCKQGPGCGDENCYHKSCCIEKSLRGCFECDSFPCSNGYFSDKNNSKGQFTGCIKYIQEVGLEKYVHALIINTKNGIKYGMGGDYSNKSEEEVIHLLKSHNADKEDNG